MSFRRYEIILPTRYNDGGPVESEKIDATLMEISTRFGGLTFRPEPLVGIWFHRGQRFEDNNVCLAVDVEETAENAAFFAHYKEVLKARFQQIEIYIVSSEIRVT
jgi:hypothetical protein